MSRGVYRDSDGISAVCRLTIAVTDKAAIPILHTSYHSPRLGIMARAWGAWAATVGIKREVSTRWDTGGNASSKWSAMTAAGEKRVSGKTAAKGGSERELTAAEMSVICSNLARGCEKQYLTAQSEDYRTLAEFFGRAAEMPPADVGTLIRYIEADLSTGFPEAKAAAEEAGDRGALRALVWSEKVTRMLSSLMARYMREGDKMLEGTGVYVCTICGFIHIGDAPPEICPVCKVPVWKFEKAEGREAQ